MDGSAPKSAGYFRVPLDTVRAIADAHPDPDVLAAWLILRRFAYGKRRELTAAGAKKIAGALGMSRPRAGGLIRSLLAMRYGTKGEGAVLMTAADWNEVTGQQVPLKRLSAPLYVTPDPGGQYAYLSDLLIPPGDRVRSYLADLCELEPETGLDALRVFLLAHAVASYGDFVGADPDQFWGVGWELEGVADYELGHVGSGGGKHYWLTREEESGTAPWTAIEAVTGGRTAAHATRFWTALGELTSRGMLCRVAVVSDWRGRLLYPLWVYGESHRRRLEGVGVIGNLASRIHGQARHAGVDVAEELACESLIGGDGSGLFICATWTARPPTIRTVYMPTLIAPTPDNLAGLATVAELSQKWA